MNTSTTGSTTVAALLLALLLSSVDVLAGSSIKAIPSGNLTSYSLSLEITPDGSIAKGTRLFPFVAVQWKGRWYFINRLSRRKVRWVAGADPNALQQKVKAKRFLSGSFRLRSIDGKARPRTVEILRKVDVSGLIGAKLYAGYVGKSRAIPKAGSLDLSPAATGIGGTAMASSSSVFDVAHVGVIAASAEGWPTGHVAMGTQIAQASDLYDTATQPAQLDVLNTYGSFKGSEDYSVHNNVTLTDPAVSGGGSNIGNLVAAAAGLSGQQTCGAGCTRTPVIPVLVLYTSSASSYTNPGPSPVKNAFGLMDPSMGDGFQTQPMSTFFAQLMADVSTFKTDLAAQGLTRAAVIMNPDFLGELQQYLRPNSGQPQSPGAGMSPQPGTTSAPTNAEATDYLTNSLFASGKGPNTPACAPPTLTFNGHPVNPICVNDAIRQALAQVKTLQPAPDTGSLTGYAFSNDVKGYIQAINWIVRNTGTRGATPFTGTIKIGWQSNISATHCTSWCTNDKLWAHYNPTTTDIGNLAGEISGFWENLGVFDTRQAYPGDFIAFDKYAGNGLNTTWPTDTSTYNQGMLLNHGEMTSFIDFVSHVAADLSVPAVLWQLPGGRVSANGGAANMSTEAQYVFGEGAMACPTNPGLNLTPLSAKYGASWAGKSYQEFLGICGAAPSVDWSAPNLAGIRNKNIVAILWGSGTCTTGMGRQNPSSCVATNDQRDEITVGGQTIGWLQNRVNRYYLNGYQ